MLPTAAGVGGGGGSSTCEQSGEGGWKDAGARAGGSGPALARLGQELTGCGGGTAGGRAGGRGTRGGDAARGRRRRRARSPSCARPLPALRGRREAPLSILSSPREALGHVPSRIKIGLAVAPQREISPSARLARPLRPGPETPGRSLGGNAKAAPPLPPPPSALRAGVAAGPTGSPPFLPFPLAFLPSASSRGTPASRRPGAPSVLPGPLAPLARPRCLLKVTRRRGRAQGTPALRRLRRRPPQRLPRGAGPGRPCCWLLPPQSRLLNQREEARPPPTQLPALPRPRLAARSPPTHGPPSSSRGAIGCGAPPAFT